MAKVRLSCGFRWQGNKTVSMAQAGVFSSAEAFFFFPPSFFLC